NSSKDPKWRERRDWVWGRRSARYFRPFVRTGPRVRVGLPRGQICPTKRANHAAAVIARPGVLARECQPAQLLTCSGQLMLQLQSLLSEISLAREASATWPSDPKIWPPGLVSRPESLPPNQQRIGCPVQSVTPG